MGLKVQASSTICTGRSREELQEPAAGLAGDPCLPWQNSWTGVGFSDASPMRVLSLPHSGTDKYLHRRAFLEEREDALLLRGARRCPHSSAHACTVRRRGVAGDLRRIRDDDGDSEGRPRMRVRTLMRTDRRGSVPPGAGGTVAGESRRAGGAPAGRGGGRSGGRAERRRWSATQMDGGRPLHLRRLPTVAKMAAWSSHGRRKKKQMRGD
ncbi:hypothetical protein ZWY2020_050097 [Hordeum vulgare]|nr:hypothetical protein ZWY2020_050097 [Hordeum vulgare]